jgi:hypothetical protein
MLLSDSVKDNDVAIVDWIYTSTAGKESDIQHNDKKANNIPRNESLDKYRSLSQSLVVLRLPSIYGK